MTTPLPVLMQEIADRLNDAEAPILATIDPVEAANNRPCLLVTPPVVDYAAGTFTTPEWQHRVMAIAGVSRWDLDAVHELTTLLEHAAEQLPELQRAEPTLYRITESQQAPAYLLTFAV